MILMPVAVAPAQAQLMNQLKGAAGGLTGGGAGGGGGLPSVSQASPTNLAGVLQYCVRNNYLNGNGASSVEQSLLNRNGGSSTNNDPGFLSGSRGELQQGNGQSFALGGGGIKQQVTQKVCSLALQHGKSML